MLMVCVFLVLENSCCVFVTWRAFTQFSKALFTGQVFVSSLLPFVSAPVVHLEFCRSLNASFFATNGLLPLDSMLQS